MRSTTPTVIAGRYEVGELLGRGGMAEVYAGVDRRLSRPVAIKLLQEPLAARDDVRVRFEAEARAAAAITQPHAVAVYDSGEHEGVPYIVMERLPGDTLADRIATGPVLSAAEARAFGRQVVGALGAAHGVGMVHRDVKPGNILLTGAGSVKIADFGIAKSIELGADLTGTGQLIGTPAYLAPEQLGGDPASPLSDIYALGVVLYEALTGRKPFVGDNAMATARAVAHGDHVPLGAARPDLDADLVRAVERAMDADPQARFPSAAAMGAALAPPAVPTVVPGPGSETTIVGPDGTQILDLSEIAARPSSESPAEDRTAADGAAAGHATAGLAGAMGTAAAGGAGSAGAGSAGAGSAGAGSAGAGSAGAGSAASGGAALAGPGVAGAAAGVGAGSGAAGAGAAVAGAAAGVGAGSGTDRTAVDGRGAGGGERGVDGRGAGGGERGVGWHQPGGDPDAEAATGMSATPSPARPPFAARSQPSRGVRIGVGVVVSLAVVYLLVQLLSFVDDDNASTTASSTTVPATTPTTAAPPTTAQTSSAVAALAAELRRGAAGLTAGDGSAAGELAARVRSLADLIERGDSGAGAAATSLIVDVARWRQAGQLTDGATLGAVQLLQRVVGVVAIGSPPATANPQPEVVVPNPERDKPGKPKKNDD